jgi:insulysin
MPKSTGMTFDKSEPIYGTEYCERMFSPEFMKEVVSGSPIPEVYLPGPNLFIPEKLDVDKLEVEHPALRPALLKDTPLSRLWHKKDDRFWLPKTNVDIVLHSYVISTSQMNKLTSRPILDTSPRNAALSKLFCELYSDSITEDVYDASLAELSFNLFYGGEYICVAAGGFSDKLPVLTETMLDKLKKYKVDPERFAKISESVS